MYDLPNCRARSTSVPGPIRTASSSAVHRWPERSPAGAWAVMLAILARLCGRRDARHSAQRQPRRNAARVPQGYRSGCHDDGMPAA